MTTGTINAMLVDDHDLVRSGIRRILDATCVKVVAEASSGVDAIQMCPQMDLDVVLMDIKMPGIGGLEATRKLLRILPGVKVLVVTVCEDDLFPSRLLQAGAVGYITKGASMEDMLQAIRTVHAGQDRRVGRAEGREDWPVISRSRGSHRRVHRAHVRPAE